MQATQTQNRPAVVTRGEGDPVEATEVADAQKLRGLGVGDPPLPGHAVIGAGEIQTIAMIMEEEEATAAHPAPTRHLQAVRGIRGADIANDQERA